MNKTGILYISPAANFFGAEGRLLELIHGLDKEIYHPIVLLPGEGLLKAFLDEMGVETIVYDFKFRVKFHLLRFFSLNKFFVQLVKDKNIKIVHNNLHYYTNNFWLGFLITKVPVFTHIRSPLWTHLFERFVMSFQFRVLCVSNAIKNIYIEKRRSDVFIKFRPDLVQVVYDGHDLDKFKNLENTASVRKELNISDDEKVIILLGAIDPVKGQDLLMEAAATIIKKHPKTKFLIVGELYKKTPEKEAYFNKIKEMQKQYHLEDNVIFTGYRKDVPKILSEIDILVQPSEHEALGGCMIEGMASGKPVIGTPVQGSPEIIGDDIAGIVMKDNSAQALADAIIYLLDHPDEAKKRGAAGLARAQELFELKTNNQQVYDLYALALKEGCKGKSK